MSDLMARWSIRRKLWLCTGVLVVCVSLLALGGFSGVYGYRSIVRSVSQRATEVALAFELLEQVGQMQSALFVERKILASADGLDRPDASARLEFLDGLTGYRRKLESYREQLQKSEQAKNFVGSQGQERQTLHQVNSILDQLETRNASQDWWLDEFHLDAMRHDLRSLGRLSLQLPKPLLHRMDELASHSRVKYRTWILLVWVNFISALGLVLLLVRLVYVWIFRPLRVLFSGSRRVATGDFRHRICLTTQDEMAELADAMNHMTDRFREVRDDLDRQVQERTREVVRSEQLASVGFLAAGVAHEINNPLASIAMCAESLEDRLHDIIQADDQLDDSEHNHEITVLRQYLRMIQDEAFRCKGITNGLLDFSRLGDVERHETNLSELVIAVIEMVRHLGKYREKKIVLEDSSPVYVHINPQEWKQVVLNLITNGLDSLDAGGTVWVRVQKTGSSVYLRVRDNGCGMTEEVQRHLFEPFFTRRRDGQGTGLGMSITYRIVSDHGGDISVCSPGQGQGSEVTICLPVPEKDQQKGAQHQYQAA